MDVKFTIAKRIILPIDDEYDPEFEAEVEKFKHRGFNVQIEDEELETGIMERRAYITAQTPINGNVIGAVAAIDNGEVTAGVALEAGFVSFHQEVHIVERDVVAVLVGKIQDHEKFVPYGVTGTTTSRADVDANLYRILDKGETILNR